jgi:hypothetical protein
VQLGELAADVAPLARERRDQEPEGEQPEDDLQDQQPS